MADQAQEPVPAYCRAITAGGTRCRQVVGGGEPGLCIWHDPAREEEATMARARGRALANTKRPITSTTEEPEILTDCPDLELTLDHLNFHLAWAVRKCSAGEMDADRLRSISQAITGLRSGLTARELARQVRELNREIKRLQGALAKKAPAKESWS